MAFKVKIKNIGKIEDAEVRIGQFTVFAGPNNTGKSFVSKLLYSIFNAMNANHVGMKEKLIRTDAKNFVIANIDHDIRQNLIWNFQVPMLTSLRGKDRTQSAVEVEKFGKFEFSDADVEFEMESSRIEHLQQYSRVIYLESPVYWKLKTALEDTRDYPVHFGDRERLSGVPGYFYDLARALKYEYTGDMAFSDVYAKLISKNVMGGKIAISETGNLSFQENGNSFSLPVTAMGIANLGILALLIERKVLDKGTFLFIDEPEAHLHPAWQVVMAESLFELSRQGVNVVIATHSADILQWLDVHVKKKPDDEQLIALNQFPVTGFKHSSAGREDKAEEDFETKMGKIMHELTKPFSDLYIEGI